MPGDAACTSVIKVSACPLFAPPNAGCKYGGTSTDAFTSNCVWPQKCDAMNCDPPKPYAPGDARIITMNPQRWIVPVNTRDYVLIVVNDGNGNPMPGRKVTVKSSRATDQIQSGGITDTDGKVYAIVTGSAAGDSQPRSHAKG